MRTLYNIIVSGSLLLSVVSCGNIQKKEAKKPRETAPVPVVVQKIAFASADKEYSYSGILEESSSISLSFAAAGTLERVYVTEGAKVSKGQVLATLDKTTAKASLESAKAVLDQAEDGYRRMEQVYKEGAVSEVKWVEMQTNLTKARSMYTLAKKNLENCTLKAPVSGWVGSVNVKTGANTAPGVSAIVIIQTDELNAKVSLPEKEVILLSQGQTVDVNIPSMDIKTKGKVSEVALKANLLNHTYGVNVLIPNKGGNLRPGMLCNVSFRIEQEEMMAILPAHTVILDIDNSKFVWIVGEDNLATRRKVTVGEYQKGGVSITSGLEEGDNVIIEGYQKVSEGMKVKISDVK